MITDSQLPSTDYRLQSTPYTGRYLAFFADQAFLVLLAMNDAPKRAISLYRTILHPETTAGERNASLRALKRLGYGEDYLAEMRVQYDGFLAQQKGVSVAAGEPEELSPPKPASEQEMDSALASMGDMELLSDVRLLLLPQVRFDRVPRLYQDLFQVFCEEEASVVITTDIMPAAFDQARGIFSSWVIDRFTDLKVDLAVKAGSR